MDTKGLLSKRSNGEAVCLRFIFLFAFICLSLCHAVAQSGGAQLDVAKLVGTDPGDIINTDNKHLETPNSPEARKYTFLLLNVKTQKFFNIGGSYGRHASLNDYGMYLWIYNNSKTTVAYNIRTWQNYTADYDNQYSYVQYIDDDKYKNGVYPGRLPTDTNREFGWIFEQAEGYNASTNKVYKLRTYGDRYLTATPDDKDGNLCDAIATTENSEYQVWKLITVGEYYELFDKSPSDLSAPIDATFLLQNPNFNYSTTNTGHWAATRNSKDIRYGVEGYFKIGTENSYQGDKLKDEEYLRDNGKYFCADIKESHQNGVIQWVTVSKPGWYIFRCNGFSNSGGLAKLFVSNLSNYSNNQTLVSTTPLNPLEENGPKDLLEAGKAFYDGKYENQVMIHVTKADTAVFGGMEHLVFGIKVEGDASTSAAGEWTAFDNFRMLYAGESEAPHLVLDEDNPDLLYLTETVDEYKNTVLHLRRSFTLNKWNTIILPVSLNYGQMKRTFGDEVLLAKLYRLTSKSVRFKTVDCKEDTDLMLEAFTPYIIKPTKNPGTNHAYTTPQLKKADNQYWLEQDEGITNAEDGVTRYTSGTMTVAENHYDISGVSLDRTLLKDKIDKHWVSTTQPSTSENKMLCKGTLAKTYYSKDGKGYFYTDGSEKRDNLAGDYFMKDGTMYKVPTGKQYGLKAFRCWFELPDTESSSTAIAPAKQVKLFINDIEESATGIEDIIADPMFTLPQTEKPDGVYNINGQLLRKSNSLEGLPKGIYIVKGKKVKV